MFTETTIQSGITCVDLIGLVLGERDHPEEATI